MRAYPTFAEYADPTTIDRRNGVADTGLTLRSFLPVTLAQTRSALLRYEGPATIIDSRVTCVRPNITNFQVSYDDLQFLRLPRFSGNISIPTDLTSSRLYANNSMTFTCSMSLGVANATLNYRSSDWNMTLCQIYVSPGFLLPEFFTPEAYWQRRNDSDFEPYSTDGSMTYLAMNYTGPNYNNNDTFDTFQEIFNGSSPGLVYQNHGEWLQVYRDNGTLKADSGMLSFSLCFPSFLTTKQNIVAYSPTNRSEPRFLYDSNSQRFLFSDIRNQHLSSSGRSAAERGILSLEKQEWRASSLEDIDYLDDLDIYHMTNFPWVDTNESATIQLTNYTSGTGFTSRADLSISGPAHEILQSGGSIAEAVQSVLTTLVQSRYLGLMFVASPDGILFNQTELVNAQVPGGGAGIVVHKVAGPTRSYLIIMICVAIHSAVVSVVIVWFCRGMFKLGLPPGLMSLYRVGEKLTRYARNVCDVAVELVADSRSDTVSKGHPLPRPSHDGYRLGGRAMDAGRGDEQHVSGRRAQPPLREGRYPGGEAAGSRWYASSLNTRGMRMDAPLEQVTLCNGIIFVKCPTCSIVILYTQALISYHVVTALSATPSKPRLDFLLRILQRPLTPRLLTPHGVDLCLGETLCLDGRVVAQTRGLCNLLIGKIGSSGAVGTLVHSDDDGATKTKVVLEGNLRVFDGAVVGPSAQVPDELGALSEAGGAQRVAL